MSTGRPYIRQHIFLPQKIPSYFRLLMYFCDKDGGYFFRVSRVPLSCIPGASLSKSRRISVIPSALAGVAVSAANAGILQVKQRRQARQPSRIRLCICFILIRYPPFQRKHIDGRLPAAVFHCGEQSEVPPRLSNGRSDCQPG